MTGTGWRQGGHDAGLLFCGAVGGYLLSILVTRLIGVPVAVAIRGWESLAARLVLGVLVIDLGRLPALLAVAWGTGRSVRLPPLVSAVVLVLLTSLLDLVVASILGQAGPLYGTLPVVLCRVAAAALLVWVTFLVFRRRRR